MKGVELFYEIIGELTVMTMMLDESNLVGAEEQHFNPNGSGRPRSLVHGWGINDVNYAVCKVVDGKRVKCPYYHRWEAMVRRAYSKASLREAPTYSDVTVSGEWKLFSDFRDWMIRQQWEGLYLDKDILSVDGKVYGPSTCAFVPGYVNTAVICRKNRSVNSHSHLPLGVLSNKKKYWVSLAGKSAACPKIAHGYWQLTKALCLEEALVRYALEDCYDDRVSTALLERVERLRSDFAEGIETKQL